MASDAASGSSARTKSKSGSPRRKPLLGALVPEIARILPHRQIADELELVPEPVQLATLPIVQHQLAERPIVAKIPRHAVEPGAQEPSGVALLLLRVEVNPGPLRDEEGVGEGRAEAFEGRLELAEVARVVGDRQGPGRRAAGFEPMRPDLRGTAGIAHPVGGHLTVLPEHERLRTGIDPPDRQVLDLRRELPTKVDDQVADPLAAGPRGVGIARPGQVVPQRLHRGDRAVLVRPVVQEVPDRLQILQAEPFLGGEPREGGVRAAQGRAVPESPGGKEVVGEVGPLAVVEVDDPMDAVLVPVGVGDRRVRREAEPVGHQDEVLGDPPGGLQVLLDQRRRHPQRLGRVVEAGRVGRVDRERRAPVGYRRPVRSRTVWSYSALLRRRTGTGPGSPAVRSDSARRTAPTQSITTRRSKSSGCAIRPLRGHRPGLDPLGDDLPEVDLPSHGRGGREGPQIQAGLGLLAGMAAEAIRLQERPDGLAEPDLRRDRPGRVPEIPGLRRPESGEGRHEANTDGQEQDPSHLAGHLLESSLGHRINNYHTTPASRPDQPGRDRSRGDGIIGGDPRPPARSRRKSCATHRIMSDPHGFWGVVLGRRPFRVDRPDLDAEGQRSKAPRREVSLPRVRSGAADKFLDPAAVHRLGLAAGPGDGGLVTPSMNDRISGMYHGPPSP